MADVFQIKNLFKHRKNGMVQQKGEDENKTSSRYLIWCPMDKQFTLAADKNQASQL